MAVGAPAVEELGRKFVHAGARNSDPCKTENLRIIRSLHWREPKMSRGWTSPAPSRSRCLTMRSKFDRCSTGIAALRVEPDSCHSAARESSLQHKDARCSPAEFSPQS